MSRAITDVGTFLARCRERNGVDPADKNLARVIETASQDLESECSRRFLTDTYARWHSGDRAWQYGTINPSAVRGDTIYLADADTQGTLALAPLTAVSSITEDGIALNVIRFPGATDPFADGESALVYDNTGIVVRAVVSSGKIARKAWSRGVANIFASVTAGYTAINRETGAGTMPEDLIEVCCDLAYLYLMAGRRGQLESMSEEGTSLSFMNKLSVDSLRVRASYTLPRSPRTLEG